MEAPLIEKLKIYNAKVQRKCDQLDIRRGSFESAATLTGLVYSFFTAKSRGRMRMGISFYTKRKRKKKANYRHHILLNIQYSHS